ncbi:hypothetical protein PtrSN002B_011641, partial [Pyrenophora tritici-repentis]
EDQVSASAFSTEANCGLLYYFCGIFPFPLPIYGGGGVVPALVVRLTAGELTLADEDPVAPEDTFAGLGRADPAALPAREAAPSPPDLEELAVGLDVDGFFDAN